MTVYAKIAAVQAALAKTGISKSRRNAQQSYDFRGIDDVYEALAPLLASNGLCILPRMIARECVERMSQKGGALFNVTVEAEFDFVCAEDGSSHVVRTFGEAMDSADKATNKAMSAAYKYAALMTFAIPTEGDNDADAVTHDVAPRQEPPPPEYITDEQITWLMDMLEGNNIPVAQLLTAAKVEKITLIRRERFEAVERWVKKRIAPKDDRSAADRIEEMRRETA